MSEDIDYDALLATWDGMSPHDDGIELCRVGNDMYDAIRALRYALHDAEAGELKNALAVGQVCIELNEERRANEALRAAAVESEQRIGVLIAENSKIWGWFTEMAQHPAARAAQEKAP